MASIFARVFQFTGAEIVDPGLLWAGDSIRFTAIGQTKDGKTAWRAQESGACLLKVRNHESAAAYQILTDDRAQKGSNVRPSVP